MIEAAQIILGGVQVGAAYACLALGLHVVFRVTGTVNLAQGAFAVLAALIVWTVRTGFGWPALTATIAATLAASAVGAATAMLVFMPGLRRLSDGAMLLLSAGVLAVLQGALQWVWGTRSYALPPLLAAELRLGGLTLQAAGPVVVATCAVVAPMVWLAITRTKQGRALQACAENPAAALLVGISVKRTMALSYTVAAGLGAVAGLIVAPAMPLEAGAGRLLTDAAVIAALIGGLGAFTGAIVGGLLLGVVSALASVYVPAPFGSAAPLALLLGTLLVRPDGLLRTSVRRPEERQDRSHLSRAPARVRRRTAWLGGLALLAASLALPLLVRSPAVLNALVIAAILFIALLGLDVAMGFAGQVNLGQAGFMAVGGYAAGAAALDARFAPGLGILAGIALAVLCSLLLSAATVRLHGLYLALATLVFGLLVDRGLGPKGLAGIPDLAIGSVGFGDPAHMYYLVVALDAVLVILLGGALGSGFGRALLAIRADPLAAAALGIPVLRLRMTALAIGAGLAALSGALYAHFAHAVSPAMVGAGRSLDLVTMLILGGEGTLVGPALGSALLTLAPTLWPGLLPFQTLATGLLLTLALLLLPRGLLGSLAALRRRAS